MQITPLVEVPFHKVAIDIIGPLAHPTDRKHRWILTLVDCATRYPDAIPLASTTTEAVAEALLSIFARVGVPVEVLSDNGPQFVSDLMKEVSRLMSIQWIHSSPYHPQANGLVEKFNGTLKKMLIRLLAERPRDWDRYLEPILFAYREVPQGSTHYSPLELLYGRSIRGPMTILREIWANQSGENESVEAYRYVFDISNRLEDTCKMVHDNLSAAQLRHKSHFDKRAKPRSLKRTLSPYIRNLALLHITIRLHLIWRLLKFMQWLARKQYLYWNVPCGDTSSKTLIDVCVCVRRHIAKLRQE